MGLEEERQW